MLVGAVIAVFIGTVQLVKSFGSRHEPEPPNSRLKLPFMAVLLAVCVGFVVAGKETVLFSILAVLAIVEIGFIAAGRNPWWMQAPIDGREQHQHRAF